MGGQICRGWIWRFWGAPIFRPEVPKPFKIGIWGPLDRKLGRPKKAKFNHDGSDPPPICGPLIIVISAPPKNIEDDLGGFKKALRGVLCKST